MQLVVWTALNFVACVELAKIRSIIAQTIMDRIAVHRPIGLSQL